MSRCPPPLGPTCWGGRSSTCRASSPMVSVLPRQERLRPERCERSVKQGAGPVGPGEHGGAAWGSQWGTWGRVGYPASELVWESGQGQRGVGVGAGDQHGCRTVPLPGLPAVSGRADRCPRGLSGTVVPVISATPGSAWERGRQWFSFISLLSSLAVLLPVLWPSCSSSRRPVGTSWVPFPPCSPGRSALSLKHPHPLGWNTQVGLSFTSGPDDLLELWPCPPRQLLPTQALHTSTAALPA